MLRNICLVLGGVRYISIRHIDYRYIENINIDKAILEKIDINKDILNKLAKARKMRKPPVTFSLKKFGPGKF